MTLPKPEHDRLANLPAAEKNTSIQNDVDVIHRSVNSGTVDRDTINAALERISACVAKAVVPKYDAAYPNPRPNLTTGAPTVAGSIGSPKPLGTPRVSG